MPTHSFKCRASVPHSLCAHACSHSPLQTQRGRCAPDACPQASPQSAQNTRTAAAAGTRPCSACQQRCVCVYVCVCARTEHGSHTESLSAMERTCRTHLAFILFDSSCPSLLCPFAYPCALLHIMRRTPVLARLHCARTPLHRGTAWPGRRTGPRPRTTGTKAAQRTDTLAHKEGPGPGAQGARRTHIHARTHRGA